MPVITATWAQNFDNAALGRASLPALTPNLAILATFTGKAGKGAFTEPDYTSTGYRRLAASGTGFWTVPDPDAGSNNSGTNTMATAAATYPECRWVALTETATASGSPLAYPQDAVFIDVLSDGYRVQANTNRTTDLYTSSGSAGGLPVVPHNSFYAAGHQLQPGDLVCPTVMPGQTAPGGLVVDLTTFYVVQQADQGNGWFTLAHEPAPHGDGSSVTIASDGQAIFTRCQPLPAGSVPQNTAIRFNPNTATFGFT